VNDTTFITVATSDDLSKYKKLHDSISRFCKGRVDQLLFFQGDKLPNDYDPGYFITEWKGTKSQAILESFKEGYRTVIYVAPHLEFIETPWELLQFANDYRPGLFDQAFYSWKYEDNLIGYRNLKECKSTLEGPVFCIYKLTRVKFMENETCVQNQQD
jgi:hypothetical protein